MEDYLEAFAHNFLAVIRRFGLLTIHSCLESDANRC